MTSRDAILRKLKAARMPFGDVPPVETRRSMVPNVEAEPDALLARFVEEAQKLSCEVTVHERAGEALEHLLALIGADRCILSWDAAHIPLPGLLDALAAAAITIGAPDDPSVRVGITGVDAALASTGTLVLSTGPGKPRTVSLLPEMHIAVLAAAQILPTLEDWAVQRRAAGLDDFRHDSSVLLISGPSRTADIAMQLVLGAHGPAALHVLIVR